MLRNTLLASIASVCLLTNCTPYQEIEQEGASGDISTPAMTEMAEPDAETYGTDLDASPAEGGAGQIDSAVAVVYKIRTREDISEAVDAMMTLADRDNDGQISREEYSILAPALAQADNTISSSGVDGAGATPGTGEFRETSDAPLLSADAFFDETAGSDGVISRDDLTSALTARFDAADADGNGELSPEEARVFAASLRFARN